MRLSVSSYDTMLSGIKMNYNKISLHLKNPLSFWANFPDNERFFWYDYQKNQLIIGADRLKALNKQEDNFSDYPYIFHTKSFFDKMNGELWEGFGGETLVFKHYFIMDDQGSYYLTCDNPKHISDFEIAEINHTFFETPTDLSTWHQLFEGIQENFSQGKCQKIVASRQLEFTSPETFNIDSILQKLVSNNPDCFIFAYQKEDRTFLGASPEILVQKSGPDILSYALAGTIPKNLKNAKQLLLNDSKNLKEHDIVVQKIRQSLLKKAHNLNIGQLELMNLKNVYHLRTILRAHSPNTSLIDWAQHLHPTPALGGVPRQEALSFLRQKERHERGLYAAPLGIIDNQGNGTMIVGIRSALIQGNNLYAYAGCGILPSSNELDELRETEIKMKTILEAL